MSACSSDDAGSGSGSGAGASSNAGVGGSSNAGTGAASSGGVAGAGGSAGASAGAASGGVGGTAGTGAADTWSNFAEGFAATYCVECHGAGSTKRDYTQLADLVRDQTEIACGVATTKLDGCGSFPPPRQFPIDNAMRDNPKPDDAARDRFVAWIQAGLPP